MALQGYQSEVDPLPLQQLVVFALLHCAAVLEAHNHVSVLYGGKAVSDRDGGATQAYLQPNQKSVDHFYWEFFFFINKKDVDFFVGCKKELLLFHEARSLFMNLTVFKCGDILMHILHFFLKI